MTFFESLGVPLKIERGNRVFPQSDRASDVVNAILRHLHDQNVEIRTNTAVSELLAADHSVRGVRLKDGSDIEADAVILAVGGASYPATGSAGDGYTLARRAGHTVVPIFPALVPLVTEEAWVKELQGTFSPQCARNALLCGEKGSRGIRRDAVHTFWRHGTDHPAAEPLCLGTPLHGSRYT